MEKIILASGSPQRRQLLDQVKLPYLAIAPMLDETIGESEDGISLVKRLAAAKVSTVQSQLPEHRARWIAGFDTIIEYEKTVLGKPSKRKQAKAMLESLAGKTHSVVTGLALLPNIGAHTIVSACTSQVDLKPMSSDEIEFYLDTEEWRGAAGAYRIQGIGAMFVEAIRGSYSNIVGLPLSYFCGILGTAGYIFQS